mmetsp:Transcript_27929/g.66371  ORF Transcript_27929/g.66371 Transcript_27929/m.66371 type:complete len:271 (-) Transcript_27929:911-1723(-)
MQVASEPRVPVDELLVIGIALGLVMEPRQIVVEQREIRPRQLVGQRFLAVKKRFKRLLRRRFVANRHVDAVLRVLDARDAVVHVVEHTRRQPAHVQDDHHAGVELIAELIAHAPGVQSQRSVEQRQHGVARDLGRAVQVVEQHPVRTAQQELVLCRYRAGLDRRRFERREPAWLEEDGVEDVSELRGRQLVHPILHRKEGHDERETQIRDRKVREEQLGVALPQTWASLLAVFVVERGQVRPVDRIVLAPQYWRGDVERRRSSAGVPLPR